MLTKITIAQSVQEQRVPASEKAIPVVVLKAFKLSYPDALIKGWYITHITYWYNDMSSGWYSDWYGQRTIIVYVYEKPNYFEVEFIDQPGELSRAIFNKYGYWYETRTRLKGLPQIILESLKQTKYADWKRSVLVEKIESAEWPETIYRFRVSKGMKSILIRMNIKGEIIQEKKTSE
ncbi:hypothetical protein ACFLRZ_03780 [Bacteroidota bacterium]